MYRCEFAVEEFGYLEVTEEMWLYEIHALYLYENFDICGISMRLGLSLGLE